jgi:hypothetical protein
VNFPMEEEGIVRHVLLHWCYHVHGTMITFQVSLINAAGFPGLRWLRPCTISLYMTMFCLSFALQDCHDKLLVKLVKGARNS